ncbi:unnamed protein product [Schistosoma intercalatum]|nr:unnamed protein product [Schistosoma intercalatum]
MKIKVVTNDCIIHNDLASSVDWVSCDEIISTADDRVVKYWNLISDQVSDLFSLPQNVFPTCMDWHPRQRMKQSTKAPRGSEIFLLGATDGKCHIISKEKRIERTSDAHQGAVLSAKWNFDGTSFATSGEDGQIKIWSRSGMLRSTLCQHSYPIYSFSWGDNSNMMLFSLDRQLVIQSLQANVKPFAWKAHDGVILQVDWNVINNQLISASEDCKYKVWDNYGRLLYSSAPFEYPVTSISWSPDGQLFAVGSYATVVLCDKLGWIHALEKTHTGGVLSIKWSPDGNQIACAGGNGRIINGYVTERCLEWNGFEAVLTDERTVVLHNLRNESIERLEFRDRVSKASFSFNYFIVVTSTQCYVYNIKNFNTPTIIELKESNVTHISQCQKYFALADGSSVYIYNYDVRLVCSLKHANIHAEQIYADSLTMSNDVIGIKDQLDKKIIHLFDPSSGKTLGDGKPISHSNEIIKISLNQMGNSFDRRLALLDNNKDLYLMSIRILGNQRKMVKLATMVSSFLWAETSNILAAITNDKLVIWFYPDIALTNSDILNLTKEEHNIIDDYGKQLELINFYRDRIMIKRADGSTVYCPISIYPDKLHQLVSLSKWNEALKLCWTVKDRILWACLAGIATNAKMLDVAEIAFAEIEEVDKVEYIRYIKSLPTTEMKNAEMLLLSGEYQEAEAILLQNHLYFRAIMLNLHAFKWNRALELANKYNLAVDIVLSMRHDYLKQLNRVEELHLFNSQSKQSTLDASELKERIGEEYLNEKKQLQESSTT